MSDLSVNENGQPRIDEASRIEEKSLIGDKNRKEKVKATMHTILITFIWFSLFVCVIMISTRIFHLIAPTCWRWLSDTELQTIDKLVFSGAIGSFVGGYFKNSIESAK